MFGSSPFGQATSSPFGSQTVFGQNTNANNPFAPKPFGSTTPFGAQSGSSLFGSTSTGVFGSQNSSPLGSTGVFGATSSPAFGSSTPAFGASATPSFGSSSAFGSSSVFGQKPSFGGFGANPAQTSSFGSSFQQTQPAFGSNPFGSTPFGTGSQPAFGTPSTPTFGAATSTPGFGAATSTPGFGAATSTPGFGAATSTPGFGAATSTPGFGAATSTPAFGSTSTPTFGATSTAFGSTASPTFGTTTGAFGVSSSPVFGSTTSSFGTSTTPGFGPSSTPAFGVSSTPSFGASSTTPSFGFGTSPSFGQSGSSPFGTQSSPSFGPSTFGAQTSPFGAQSTTPSFGSPGFGQSTFGSQQVGSRVVPYTPTAEMESGTQPASKLESISAMPTYKEKSHEELRWEDYQRGDKGGPSPSAQSSSGLNFGTSGFGSSSTPAFGTSTSSSPFSSTSPNPFAPKPSPFGSTGFGTSSPSFGSSPFGVSTTTANPFSSTPASTPSMFNSTPSFGQSTSPSPSLFSSSSSAFGTSTSLFGTPAQATTPGFSNPSFGNTQPSPLFQSTTPSLGQTNSPFGQNTATFGQSTPSFSQPSLFSSTSSGFGGNIFSSAPSLLNTSTPGFGQGTPASSTPFQSVQPPQNANSFGLGNFGQTSALGGFGATPSMFSQNTFSQPSTTQAVVQQAVPSNPFGTLPVLPQMSIGRTGTSPSIQYGISSMPVVDKPAPVRISSILTSRHLSQRRIRLPARRYHPQSDGPKVPFFNDDEETSSAPKADALYIPRENPRALVIRPVEKQQSQMSAGKTTASNQMFDATHENGKIPEAVSAPPMNGLNTDDKEHVENGFDERSRPVKQSQKPNGTSDSYSVTLTGHRAGEAAVAYEHGPEIEVLMPKLRHSDYYTEPRIQELAAKERVDNGYCQRVKDFVVGRHGYGSIKFIGETDVRGLDLESLIQFNNREVIVYMDESKKPPVGQGLNKRAEVNLLNIKCFDKKTGLHYTEGPRIEKYKEMLKRKAEDQGAEFVSYDPVKGEWKFRVEHFSKYSLREVDDDDNGSW